MQELLVDFITSLDGYASAEGWPGWWGLEGPEYLGWLGEQPERGYMLLMGAKTYRLMSWANTELVSGDAIEAVREMKRTGTSPMRTIGSLSLCRSLLEAGLVDRYRVVVFPVITGSTGSERIYDGYPDVGLDMLNSRTFDGRIQLLEYAPRVLEGPPGTKVAS
jgi:dihydrofolate reductase